MSDWRFWDYEWLPVAVAFLFQDEVKGDKSFYEDFLEQDSNFIFENVSKSSEAVEFMNLAFDAVKSGKIHIKSDSCSDIEADDYVLEQVFVEPLSFFAWAETQGKTIPYQVREAIKYRENELRVKNYKSHLTDKDNVVRKMNEPLWFLEDAIMYLHGYETCEDKNMDFDIVNSDKDMKIIKSYAYDSHKIKNLELISIGNSFPVNKCVYKVKPIDFMRWAASLNISFPNLLISDKRGNDNSLISREKDTLLKMIIGMAVKGYSYNPKLSKSPIPKEISDDLMGLGIKVSDDTVRKWLKEASDLLPTDNMNID